MHRSQRHTHPPFSILSVLRSRPAAAAQIHGSAEYPNISGIANFYQTPIGVIVYTEVHGLPAGDSPCDDRIFGFHIHSGNACSGDCEHPYHAGDLPPLFGNNGFALSVFLTDRFSVDEINGKTIIIHDHPDDFTTQPSGNSGTKIACGIIQ